MSNYKQPLQPDTTTKRGSISVFVKSVQGTILDGRAHLPALLLLSTVFQFSLLPPALLVLAGNMSLAAVAGAVLSWPVYLGFLHAVPHLHPGRPFESLRLLRLGIKATWRRAIFLGLVWDMTVVVAVSGLFGTRTGHPIPLSVPIQMAFVTVLALVFIHLLPATVNAGNKRKKLPPFQDALVRLRHNPLVTVLALLFGFALVLASMYASILWIIVPAFYALFLRRLAENT